MNLLLSLTEQCNLRCSYCYYKVSHAERALVMSDEILEKAITLAFERTLKLKQDFFISLFLAVSLPYVWILFARECALRKNW